MSEPRPPVDFATILGAAVHDMKNSLQLQLQKLQQVAAELEGSEAARPLADIHYEAKRLNTGLIQLLNLYRNEQTQFPLQLEAQFIDELLEDVLADTEFYAGHYQVDVSYHVADGLDWYMDKTLIGVLLQDVITNAVRYARQRVWVTAKVVDKHLEICVCDDGKGYPDEVIDNFMRSAQNQMATNISAGRTGLGLYFAKRIAESHQRGENMGQISLQNDAGGIFTLRLP